MGTLSTRDLTHFEDDLRKRIDGLSDDVGGRIGRLSSNTPFASSREGRLTKKLERLTAALPSLTWLVAAGIALAGSLALRLLRRDDAAHYVGMGVPAFLAIGIYNKIVKVRGSDRYEALAEDLH